MENRICLTKLFLAHGSLHLSGREGIERTSYISGRPDPAFRYDLQQEMNGTFHQCAFVLTALFIRNRAKLTDCVMGPIIEPTRP